MILMADDDIDQIEYESAEQAAEQTGEEQALSGIDEVEYQRRKQSNVEKAQAAASAGGSAVLAGSSRVASVLGGAVGAGVAALKKIPTPGQPVNQPQGQPQQRQFQTPPRNIYPQPPPVQMSQRMQPQSQSSPMMGSSQGLSILGGSASSGGLPPAFNLGGSPQGGALISIFGMPGRGSPPAFNLGFGQPQQTKGMKPRRGRKVPVRSAPIFSIFGSRPAVKSSGNWRGKMINDRGHYTAAQWKARQARRKRR